MTEHSEQLQALDSKNYTCRKGQQTSWCLVYAAAAAACLLTLLFCCCVPLCLQVQAPTGSQTGAGSKQMSGDEGGRHSFGRLFAARLIDAEPGGTPCDHCRVIKVTAGLPQALP